MYRRIAIILIAIQLHTKAYNNLTLVLKLLIKESFVVNLVRFGSVVSTAAGRICAKDCEYIEGFEAFGFRLFTNFRL